MLWPLRSSDPVAPEPPSGESLRLHAALDVLADAVLLMDSDGQVLDANLGAARRLGSSEADLREDVGLLAAALEPSDMLWLRRALGMACQGQNRRGTFSRFGPAASGPCEVRVEPLRNHPGGAVAALVLRALPPRARPLEDSAEKLGLHAVDLAVELEALLGRLRKASPEELPELSQSIERMQRELAALGRRAVGEVPGTHRPEELVEPLVRAVRHALPSNVRMRSRTAVVQPPVRCEPEVLRELGLAFARLAMVANARELAIEAVMRGNSWALSFAHDGAPLPPALVERFSRPNPDDEARPIDIAAWRSKARYWGGDLEVVSQSGVGMRFTLLLPLLRATAAPARQPDRPMPRRVLVLESEADPREHMQALLREAGSEVALASDAVGALDALEREDGLDLVLLGADMPSPGPRHILRLLRRLRPEIPVVVVGGYTNVPLVRECLANGALAFLPRRFGLLELRRALETVPA